MDEKFFADLLPESEDSLLDIHTAASIGCVERVRDVIESSENKDIIDERNKKGWTPLMYAASCANLKVALLLLEEDAETNIRNNEGQTALILASKCGSGDVVNLLIDNGASVNDRDLKGWTSLFHAVAFGHRSVVKLLIERGAVVDISDNNERITPLMLAATAGHERIVQDLLQSGVNVNVESKFGETARSLALKHGHMNVKNLLDSYLQSKRRIVGPNPRYPDLASLLKDLQLTKYYYIFENQRIDLRTFWLLTDDDLKEIGIQLLGPRKKICMTIAQHYQEQSQKNNPKESANFDNVLMENKKLHLYIEKLKSIILQEKSLKIAAERNLTNVIQGSKNCEEMFKSTLDQVLDFLQKLKENQDYLRNLLCSSFQDLNFSSNSHMKFKMESILQSLDCMQKLFEIQHQNITSVQQNRSHNSNHK